MKYTSQFDNGSKVWCIVDGERFLELTVGRVVIKSTASPGIDDEHTFDNYKPQYDYSEEYMCVETGIGTGAVFTAGKNIFATAEQAQQTLHAMQEEAEQEEAEQEHPHLRMEDC